MGDAAAWVAAIIAAGAMGVAFWQAREAKESRHAAQAQAAAAKESADIAAAGVLQAKRSAQAAEEQAESSRRSAELAEAAEAARQRTEDETEGPQFQCLRNPTFQQSEDVVVEVRMMRGPTLARVEVSAIGNTSGVAAPEGSLPPGAPYLLWENMQINDARRVLVGFDDLGDPDLVTVRLRCTESGGRERQWERRCDLRTMPERFLQV